MKIRIEMRPYWIQVASEKSNESVLIRDRRGQRCEICMMHLQAKEHQALLASSRNSEKPGTNCPSEPPEGTNPAYTLVSGFWPP